MTAAGRMRQGGYACYSSLVAALVYSAHMFGIYEFLVYLLLLTGILKAQAGGQGTMLSTIYAFIQLLHGLKLVMFVSHSAQKKEVLNYSFIRFRDQNY